MNVELAEASLARGSGGVELTVHLGESNWAASLPMAPLSIAAWQLPRPLRAPSRPIECNEAPPPSPPHLCAPSPTVHEPNCWVALPLTLLQQLFERDPPLPLALQLFPTGAA